MKRKLKGFDVYFTLESPACVLVGAHDESEVEDIFYDKILANMSREELVDRILAAIEYDGIKIVSIDEVDELEEE